MQWTIEAEQVATRAKQIALLWQASEVNSAHLLLALHQQPCSLCEYLFAKLAVFAEPIRSMLQKGRCTGRNDLLWSSTASLITSLAEKEAVRLGLRAVSPAHLLLAICVEGMTWPPPGPYVFSASTILKSTFGLRLDVVKAQTLDLLGYKEVNGAYVRLLVPSPAAMEEILTRLHGCTLAVEALQNTLTRIREGLPKQ